MVWYGSIVKNGVEGTICKKRTKGQKVILVIKNVMY